MSAEHDATFWRALLVKYIDHVSYEEGSDFLSVREPDKWTDDEWAELKRLSLERP